MTPPLTTTLDEPPSPPEWNVVRMVLWDVIDHSTPQHASECARQDEDAACICATGPVMDRAYAVLRTLAAAQPAPPTEALRLLRRLTDCAENIVPAEAVSAEAWHIFYVAREQARRYLADSKEGGT